MDPIKAIEDALAAGPTPGPWTTFGATYVFGREGNVCEAGAPTASKVVSHTKADLSDRAQFEPAVRNAAYIAACHPEAIRSLLDRLREAEAAIERQEHALHSIASWCEAYPLSVFPEPDFARAHELLTAGGITLDAISASNMRHVVNGIRGIVTAAMKETP